MKSDVSHISHHILPHSSIREVFTSSLSLSDLIGESRSKQVANLSHLDYRVKPDNDSMETDAATCRGRSMIEMLGVLAIIGVLSVGAISGYGKAMFKYKLNKQTEQLNQVIGTIVRYKSSLMLNPNPTDDEHFSDFQLVPLLSKLGEIPKEMYTSDERFIKDAFGTQYEIYNRNKEKDFITMRTNNLDRNESSFQICKNLYLIAKEWHNELSAIYIVAYHGENYADKEWYCGDNNEVNICYKITDLKLTKLDDICRTAAEEQGHYSVVLKF